MKKMQTAYKIVFAIGAIIFMASCVNEENSPGYEYMPDMYRSPAVEAYVDYGEIRDTLRPELMETMSARKPATGTVPMTDQSINDMPYTIPNTVEGYELAGKSLKSPIEETEAVVEEGKKIYTNFCIQCHGKEGQGNGAVVTKGGHPAPGAYNGPLKDLPEGKMFHTLTYGKGVMGSHASQLTKLERWKVVAYVKELQKLGSEEETEEGETEESPSDTTSAEGNQTAQLMN
jgi:mono/diheme cytochrome c family protein